MNEEAYFEMIFQVIADWFNETTTTEEFKSLQIGLTKQPQQKNRQQKSQKKGGGDL